MFIIEKSPIYFAVKQQLTPATKFCEKVFREKILEEFLKKN